MKLHHQLANSLGYDLIRHKKSHLELKDHLPKILAHYGIDTLIDVGANEGQFLSIIKESGFTGRTFSFEPIPAMAQMIVEKFKGDARTKIFNMALGESDSVLELNVYDSSVFSSFKTTNQFSKENFPEHVKLKEKISVPVKRMDEVLAKEINKDNAVFLKVDTQGFDLEVMKGATGILPQVKAVTFECSVIPIYDGCPNYLETIEYFSQLGFVPSGFFPVSREDKSLALIEFDAVMVRR